MRVSALDASEHVSVLTGQASGMFAQLGMCRQLCAQELTFLGRAASSSGRFLARLKVPLTYPSTCTTSC